MCECCEWETRERAEGEKWSAGRFLAQRHHSDSGRTVRPFPLMRCLLKADGQKDGEKMSKTETKAEMENDAGERQKKRKWNDGRVKRRWREMESLAAAHPDFHGARLLFGLFFLSWLTETRNAPDKEIQGTEAAKHKQQQQQTVRKIIPISVERDCLLHRAAAVTHL